MCPIVSQGGTTFVYVKHRNVYVVGATKANANVMLMFVFIHKLIEVFKTYFGELEEESIRDNFIIIYELLDEVMDFGYPQYMEGTILQEYITQQGRKVEAAAPKPPMALTNASARPRTRHTLAHTHTPSSAPLVCRAPPPTPPFPPSPAPSFYADICARC